MSTNERIRLLAKCALERTCVLRSLKVALLVGTVLALINHFDSIRSGSVETTASLQILLTYAVPYSVSTFGSAMQAAQMELNGYRKGPDSSSTFERPTDKLVEVQTSPFSGGQQD